MRSTTNPQFLYNQEDSINLYYQTAEPDFQKNEGIRVSELASAHMNISMPGKTAEKTPTYRLRVG
jgi:hypothetical protein